LPDPDLQVLWGWASGNFANSANSREGTASELGTAIASTAICLLTLDLISLGIIAAAFWTDRQLANSRRRPGFPVQLRLSPKGIAQRDGIGPVHLRPWREDNRLEWTPTRNGGVRIHCIAESELGFVTSTLCDFEIVLPPDQEEALRSRLSAWIENLHGRVRLCPDTPMYV